MDRPDVVLAAIPALAVSGVVVSRLLQFLESTVGVAVHLEAVPYTFLGLLGALSVIALEVSDPSFETDR